MKDRTITVEQYDRLVELVERTKQENRLAVRRLDQVEGSDVVACKILWVLNVVVA